MTNILTAAQIVSAYNGYSIDYKNSEEHKAALDLRNQGNSNRAWNRACPEIVMLAKKMLSPSLQNPPPQSNMKHIIDNGE